MADLSDLELLDALGLEAKQEKKAARSPREERIIAGFEEIQRFADENARTPEHGENNDIFERLYATRLDQIRKQDECRSILQGLDHQGLLSTSNEQAEIPIDDLDDEELLAKLGVDALDEGDLTQLHHVKSRAEVKAAVEIANRSRCDDFESFRGKFEVVRQELKTGSRETRKFELKSEIRPGSFFIVGGQSAFVAEMGEVFSNAQGRRDARLRVIFDNGTESNMLMRSLQRALHKDDAGRRITDPLAGPLFSSASDDEDLASGTIYVLQSKSDHPFVKEHRDVLHKIGFTSGSVKKRIANAKKDPTFLMAEVKIVATYNLFSVHGGKLENLLHKIFNSAKLDVKILDRLGFQISPKEWFLVPVSAIDEAVTKIIEGTIGDYEYDVKKAGLELPTTDKILAQSGGHGDDLAQSFIVGRGDEIACIVDLDRQGASPALATIALFSRGRWTKNLEITDQDRERVLELAKPSLDAGPDVGEKYYLSGLD